MRTENRWGSTSQIGAAFRDLQDLRGNNDRLWGNETRPAGTVSSSPAASFERNPLVLRASTAAATGLSTRDERAELEAFLRQQEQAFGTLMLKPEVAAELKNPQLFAAQKAIELARVGKSPADVFERFVPVGGSVDGKQVENALVFTQHWLPQGKATGDVVVMSPGFLETGHAFLEQVHAQTKQGVHVVVFDHQWAGNSRGGRSPDCAGALTSKSPKPRVGGLQDGHSVALHTAGVVMDAAKEAKARYGDKARVTVLGESMGAGPGALGAALMAAAGKLELDQSPGQPWPDGVVNLVLQAPFLRATPTVMNQLLTGASHIPLLNRLALPATGLPDFVDDARGEQLVAQAMVRDDMRAQLQAFSAALPFLSSLQDLLASGVRPSGHVHILHDKRDPLADHGAAAALAAQLGEQATLTSLDRGNHGLSASDVGPATALLDAARARARQLD